MAGLFTRLFGLQKTQLPPFDFARNRFRVQKEWPPNLRDMTDKQQFRFERKFKRRIKLKSVRPVWDRWIRITQWSMISFIVVYGVFFHDFAKDPMNPRPGEQVFEGIRGKMWGVLGNFYTHTEATIKPERGARRQEPLGGLEAGEEGRSGPGPRPGPNSRAT